MTITQAALVADVAAALAEAQDKPVEITENGQTVYVLLSAKAYADLVGPPVPSAFAALCPSEDLSDIDFEPFLPKPTFD